MELSNQDLLLIKKHLHGRLDEAGEREFAARLAADSEFGAEFDFHQKLFTTLRDSDAERLKQMLVEVENSNFQKPPQRNFRTWLSWLLLAAAVGTTAWFVFFREKPQPAAEQKLEKPAEQLVPTTPEPAKIEPEKTPDPNPNPQNSKTQTTQKPIAKTENFQPNPSWEKVIESQTRSQTANFKLEKPAVGQVIRATGGQVKLNFKGNFAPEEVADAGLSLSIFDNLGKKPLTVVAVPLVALGSGFAFDFSEKLAAGAGLFYFTLEENSSGEIIFVGKFSVE